MSDSHSDAQIGSVTDEDLMRRVQNGDEEAFHVLFDRYAAHLVNFAYRSLRSREEAEDIAQETLCRVYRAKERFDPSRLFRPWAFSIAARLVSNQFRDRKRHNEVPLDAAPEDGQAFEPPDMGPLPVEEAEKRHLASQVRMALDSLPENQRTAVLLARFEEMPYEEIAKAMNLSLQAVTSLMFRARQTLKITLAELTENTR